MQNGTHSDVVRAERSAAGRLPFYAASDFDRDCHRIETRKLDTDWLSKPGVNRQNEGRAHNRQQPIPESPISNMLK
jgi:hypothetical protein